MFHHWFVEAMCWESNVSCRGVQGDYEQRRIALCEADEMYVMGALNEFER